MAKSHEKLWFFPQKLWKIMLKPWKLMKNYATSYIPRVFTSNANFWQLLWKRIFRKHIEQLWLNSNTKFCMAQICQFWCIPLGNVHKVCKRAWVYVVEGNKNAPNFQKIYSSPLQTNSVVVKTWFVWYSKS